MVMQGMIIVVVVCFLDPMQMGSTGSDSSTGQLRKVHVIVIVGVVGSATGQCVRRQVGLVVVIRIHQR